MPWCETGRRPARLSPDIDPTGPCGRPGSRLPDPTQDAPSPRPRAWPAPGVTQGR